jgi:hypothetical protein
MKKRKGQTSYFVYVMLAEKAGWLRKTSGSE